MSDWALSEASCHTLVNALSELEEEHSLLGERNDMTLN
jgi:hypothetical protein